MCQNKKGKYKKKFVSCGCGSRTCARDFYPSHAVCLLFHSHAARTHSADDENCVVEQFGELPHHHRRVNRVGEVYRTYVGHGLASVRCTLCAQRNTFARSVM